LTNFGDDLVGCQNLAWYHLLWTSYFILVATVGQILDHQFGGQNGFWLEGGNFSSKPSSPYIAQKTFGSSGMLMLSYSSFRIKSIFSQEAEMSWYHQLALSFQLRVEKKLSEAQNGNFEKQHHCAIT